MTAQMLTMAYATISGVSFCRSRSARSSARSTCARASLTKTKTEPSEFAQTYGEIKPHQRRCDHKDWAEARGIGVQLMLEAMLHLRSSVTERMKPDGHQSGLAHYAVYDRAHRVEQTKT